MISALGWIMGDSRGIELISLKYAPSDLHKRDINMYLIGSSKVNRWTAEMMAILQEDTDRCWNFDHAQGESRIKKGDWKVSLYCRTSHGDTSFCGKQQAIEGGKGNPWIEDYGLLIREPNPKFPERIVLIMAGAHSLGTASACLVATRPALIDSLRNRLPPGTLEDPQARFWALVRGEIRKPDYLIDEEGVTNADAGVYH